MHEPVVPFWKYKLNYSLLLFIYILVCWELLSYLGGQASVASSDELPLKVTDIKAELQKFFLSIGKH